MLIVDASVVVKWFVEEPLRSEARHILEYRKDIISPDFVQIEVANVVWKKLRRGEIGPYHAREIVALLSEAVPEFVSTSRILKSANEFAIELDHPIYDCLYLACLAEPHDLLVTGDKRLFNKTRSSRFEDQVRYLDDADLALPLFIPLYKIEQIIRLSEQFEVTHRNLIDRLTEGQTLPIYNTSELGPVLNSPAYRRLNDAIEMLPEAEQADLLALGWLGRGYEQQGWLNIRARAESSIHSNDVHFLEYVASMTIYIAEGLAALRNSS
jgi:predicted nucleic acid-binding protein